MYRFNFDDIYYPENISEMIHKDTEEKMIDHIRRANRDHMDEIAMTYMGVKITYQELFNHIEEYARALKQAGMYNGDMITICLPNIPETVYYFYACNEIGVTPYLIDPRCTFEKMKTCVSDSNSRLFVCEAGTYFSKVAEYEGELQVEKLIVVSPLYTLNIQEKLTVKGRIAKVLFDIKDWSGKKKYPDGKSPNRVFQRDFINCGKKYTGEYKAKYDSERPAIIVNTSGTSGDSVKGAVHINRSYNILSNQTDFITDEIRRGYTCYAYIPFFSMYGSAVGMHTALSHGVIMDLIPKFNGKKSLEEIIKNKANILIGVPNLFEKISQICEERNIDMSFAKVFVTGGDNVSPDQFIRNNEILQKHGMKDKIIYGYGSTEGMMMITTSQDERSYVYGSSGIPHTCVSVRIIDPETSEWLGYDKEGEICVHTPTLMLGYLNRPEENKAVFLTIDGERYFKTGDKGYLTETGHLFFTGRYKRIMKRPDGHQTSPIPIENSLCTHPLVENAVVIGIKKDKNATGVIPTAFIQLVNRKSVTRDEIKNIIETSIKLLSGEREMALAYRVVESIPVTENGKIDYRAMEKYDFNTGEYYAVEDPITKECFKNVPNVTILKVRKA